MNYFEQLRQGGPGYEVRESTPVSFTIYCDQENDSEVLAFQTIARDAKAQEDGDWEVKLAPSGGFKGRSIPGWQGRVYLMAAIAKVG
ncbi:hypothetical protein M2226_008938 [Bradyrhizobium elkanii]|uniref:hypothetical protein n=1 Tax=Bradyrhizobium elkanii TaxID=29448 RepID=UPI002226ACB9|nr:hypothetical protein [Bradyrhizobium elkanii]MCW2130194.1 hypothetical protein [Bradyrhizobium elkanii]MCW2167871.1 hypothetical protein [Bradyrhizobium elkanii]